MTGQNSLPSLDHPRININQRDRLQGVRRKFEDCFNHHGRGFLRGNSSHPGAHAGNGQGEKPLFIGKLEGRSRG